jgi:hypothetical protein
MKRLNKEANTAVNQATPFVKIELVEKTAIRLYDAAE